MISRITLSICIITSCIFSMLNGEAVEFKLVEIYHFNWLSAAIFYRVFILTTLFVSQATLFGYNKLISKIFLGIIVSIITFDTLHVLISNHAIPIFILNYFKWQSLPVILLTVASYIYFVAQIKIHYPLKKGLILLLVVSSIGLSFIRIVYIDDWINASSNNKTLHLTQVKKLFNDNGVIISENNTLIPFFSTTCPFCRIAAKKMAISKQKKLLGTPYIVFPSSSKNIDEFLQSTGLKDNPYIVIDEQQFVALGGSSLPSIFEVSEKNSQQWVGEEFNNLVLWKLSKYVH